MRNILKTNVNPRLGRRFQGFLIAVALGISFGLIAHAQKDPQEVANRQDCMQEYQETTRVAWEQWKACTAEAAPDPDEGRRKLRFTGCDMKWAGRAETAVFKLLQCAAVPTR